MSVEMVQLKAFNNVMIITLLMEMAVILFVKFSCTIIVLILSLQVLASMIIDSMSK